MNKKVFIFYQIVFFVIMLQHGNFSFANTVSSVVISNLKAFHQSGQTFLVWQAADYRHNSIYRKTGDDVGGIRQKDYKRLIQRLKKDKKNGTGLKYRVYRSETPFCKNDFTRKNLVGEIKPFSVYYPYLYGIRWYDDRYSNRIIPRLAISDGKMLSHNSEIFVFTCKKAGKAYYAVVPSINGKNLVTLNDNYLKNPIEEKEGIPEPVFQWKKSVEKKQYGYNRHAGTVYYYSTWLNKPYANRPQTFLWSVAVPDNYREDLPCVLQLGLHEWGGHLDYSTYWYDIKPSTIRIATANCPVQDWWYGYREKYRITKNPGKNEVVQNYTEKRILHFIDWVKTRWRIDDSLVFAEGQSMGGTGAMHLGMKHGDRFAYLNSWVGIGSWRYSSYFRNGESRKWGAKEEMLNYNGIKFDDWMDLSWWLRNNVSKETPFLSFANGKNDGNIGWKQSVKTLEALIETKRPFVFAWGMAGHGQRARFMMNPQMMRSDRSLPAFRNCSLDNNPGTATKLQKPKPYTASHGQKLKDWYDGDFEGQINAYLRWKVLMDTPERYEIRLMLSSKAPKNKCTVDMTPRRLQKFQIQSNQKIQWQNMEKSGKVIQKGTGIVDSFNLLTLERLEITKAGNTIILTKTH